MKKLLHFLCFWPFLLPSQEQIGSTIFSENSGELIGISVDLSNDGNRMIIGSINNDSEFPNNGIVRVFEKSGNSWVQLGSSIEGIAEGDQFGQSTAISADGNTIAVGAPGSGVGGGFEVWRWENNQWNFVNGLQSTIDSELAGFSIDISDDGSIISVGYPYNTQNGNSAGLVRVWEIDGLNIAQLGNDILGEGNACNLLGFNMSLSGSGNRIILGTPTNCSIINGGGKARVYELVNGSWNLLGNSFNGSQNQSLGAKVSMSKDGNRIAFNRSFTVEVFEYSNDQWNQIGAAIDNAASVALSNDFNKIAVGNSSDDVSGEELGSVRILDLVNGTWETSGNTIIGDNDFDRFGFNVSISSDSNILAASSISFESNSSGTGYVKSYDVSNLLSENEFNQPKFRLYPNPVKDILNIELSTTNSLDSIDIYNNLGQLVLSKTDTRINVSGLQPGLYLVQIRSSNGKSNKKIVIEQ